jgi:hypothetical protein
MPDYCFYKKGENIIVLDRSDATRATSLNVQGYHKQFEEVTAANEKSALVRFRDLRQEGQATEHAFATGAAFVALIVGLMVAVDFLFLK